VIAITSDTDWAPAEIIQYMLSILDDRGIRATFFCTDKCAKSVIGTGSSHELAIHPFFKSLKTDRTTLARLLRMYPNAKGTRSHSSYFHTRLTDIYEKHGIEYDSNWFVPQIVKPFMLFNGILEIPMNFMDNLAFGSRSGFTPRPRIIKDTPQPLVFNFHPIHVFLNTESHVRYLKAKPYYHNPAKLWKLRNRHTTGTYDYLLEILELIRKKDLVTCTMSEISSRFRKELHEGGKP
jgi:hypothetical protein